MNVGRYAFRKEVGGELLDVCLLVKEKMILGLFELDSQEVMTIAFVFHFPFLGTPTLGLYQPRALRAVARAKLSSA